MMVCLDDTHPDAVVTCPYNAAHKISRSRLQRHLVKCEKHFPEGYLEICPYNATHRFFKAEMKEHILSCPMRRFLEPALYQNSARTKDYITNRFVCETRSTIDLVESWSDDESDFQSKKQEAETLASFETDERPTDENDSEDENDYSQPLRRPYGYSELMMMEANNPVEDDMVSVTSCMGMGRGRSRGTAKSSEKNFFRRIGMARGKGITLSKNL